MRGRSAFLILLGMMGVSGPAQADEPQAIFCSIPKPGSPYEEFSYVRLSVAKSGRVTWNGSHTNARQLEEYLGDVTKEDPPPTFHITIASNTPYSVFQPVVKQVQYSNAAWMTLRTPKRNDVMTLCNMKKLQHLKLPDKLHIWLHADGQILWNGAPVTKEQLDQWSRAAARENPRQVVNIHPDTAVTYGEIIELMAKFMTAGLSDFAIGNYGHIVPERSGRPN